MSQRINLILFLCLFSLLTACAASKTSLQPATINMEKIKLVTDYQLNLATNFSPAKKNEKGIIL